MLPAMAKLLRRLALVFLLPGSLLAQTAATEDAPAESAPEKPPAAPAVSENDAKELKAVYDMHLVALQKEDVAGVMATIHPQSPLRAPTLALLKRVKGKYDFHFTVTDQTVVSVTKEEARVAFTLVTEKVSGPQFRPNRVRGFLVFRKWKNSQSAKSEDAWRLYDTEVAEADYLEE
jgi:hypothetical protein